MRNMLRNGTLALALMGSAAFLVNPSFAVESDTNPPAGPEVVAPHADLPNFQLDWVCCDDQTINDGDAPYDDQTVNVGDAPDVVVVED